MHLSKHSQGFTLIELLITIVIISILSVGIVPSFTGYIRNQNLRQAQEQLKSDLRSVQNKALTGSLSDQIVGGARMRFWGIKFLMNSNIYHFFISSINTTCPTTYSAGQYQRSAKFDQNITIRSSNSPSGSCMFFSVDNGDITVLGAGSASPIILGYGSTSAVNSRRVHFNSSGIVYTQND